MELIIEIFSHSGRLKERVRVTGPQVGIGRGYNNQVILSDQYVCPTHIRLEYDNQEKYWKLYDLSSRNGTYLVGNGRIEHPHHVRSGDEIELGHSRLRLVLPEHEVPATKIMPPGRVLADYFSMPIVAMTMLILIMATFALNQYLSLGTKADWKELVLEGVLFLSVPFIWACIWALIGRISVHDTRFAYHLSIGSVVVLASFVLMVVMEYLSFSFNSHSAIVWIENSLEGLMFASMLVAAMWMSTNMNRTKRWLVGHGIAWGLIGFSLFYEYARYDAYSVEYEWFTLKPPFAQFGQVSSVEGFMTDLDKLVLQTEQDLDPPQ